MKPSPLVQIFVPCYNAEKYLAHTLQSLAEQTYTHYTVTVVDNQSTDQTPSIAKEFAEVHDNFEYICNERNLGGEGNSNKCLGLITAKYGAIYHADDHFTPTIIQESVNALEKNTSMAAVSTLGKIIDENSKFTGYKYHLPFVYRGESVAWFSFKDLFESVLRRDNSFIICPSVMMKKEWIAKSHKFYFSQFKSSSDLGLWLEFARLSGFGTINQSLIHYRVHSGQGSETLIRKNILVPDIVKVVRYYQKEFDHPKKDQLLSHFYFRQLLMTFYRRHKANKLTWNRSLLELIKVKFKESFFLSVFHTPKYFALFCYLLIFGRKYR